MTGCNSEQRAVNPYSWPKNNLIKCKTLYQTKTTVFRPSKGRGKDPQFIDAISKLMHQVKYES